MVLDDEEGPHVEDSPLDTQPRELQTLPREEVQGLWGGNGLR